MYNPLAGGISEAVVAILPKHLPLTKITVITSNPAGDTSITKSYSELILINVHLCVFCCCCVPVCMFVCQSVYPFVCVLRSAKCHSYGVSIILPSSGAHESKNWLNVV